MIILENEAVVDWRVETAEDCSYLAEVPAATTLGVYMTMKQFPSASDAVTGATLTFVDNGASNDLIQRDKGSWLDGKFAVGQEITIGGGNTNDGTYTILAVTADTIEVATASFSDETTSTYTAVAAIPDSDYILLETIAAANNKHAVFEMAGTGLRFVRASGTGTIRVWVRS